MATRSFNLISDRRSLLWLALAGGFIAVVGQSERKRYDIKEVALAEGRAMQESGALVVDVRKDEGYRHRHIVGAMLLPLATLKLGVPAALAYAKSLPILVYCGDGLAIGPEATFLLNQAGFSGAVNLRDGIEGWDGAGYPVTRASPSA